MKKSIIASIALLLCGVMLCGAEPQKKSLKILTIGNSFSNSLNIQFPRIVASDPSCEMLLDARSATLGGCSMERHWNNHVKSEKDPSFKPYVSKTSTLRDQLIREKWDIVTIQQASHFSWQAQTFEPYATNLIALVKELAPTAEIVIQQTWSYNACDSRLHADNPKCWKHDGKPVDQTRMYELLDANYRSTAEKHHLRVIPVGDAIQLYRKYMGKKLFSKTMADFEAPSPKSVMTNDVVARFYERKDPKTGEKKLAVDSIHLNARGQYLQSLVWYAMLFDKDPEKVTYKPDFVTDEEAALFKKCAKEAVKNYKQVRK